MNLTDALRIQVRGRAGYACEFCGVSEADTAGELTIDHFLPRTRGGTDAPENLVYCCNRCNQYKADYWPEGPQAPRLWHPREEPSSLHLLALSDGTLHPLSPVGAFTLRRLRLNRPPLIAYRLHRLRQAEEVQLLTRYREVVDLLERLSAQHARLLEDQRELLLEQRRLLDALLKQIDRTGERVALRAEGSSRIR